jgi:hypothetical protein
MGAESNNSGNNGTLDIELRNVQIGLGGQIGSIQIADGTVRAVSADPGSGAREYIDLGGRTVLPGLRDMHAHLPSCAAVQRAINVSEAATATEAAEIVARRYAGDDVLVARAMHNALWPEPPHKDLLENVLPGVVVVVKGNDGHTAWLSPAALARVGMGDHPTGVLVEQDCFRATHELGHINDDQAGVLVSRVSSAAAARGVTQVLDFDGGPLSTWVDGVQRHGLDIRVVCGVRGEGIAEAIESGLRTGFKPDGVGGLLSVGPIKLFSDGSLNTKTALLDVPYAGDHPDPDTSDHGSMELSPDELDTQIRQAAENGLGVAIHAIGNRANTLVLDAFERALADPSLPRVGFRVEHAQLVRPADVQRFARLGVVASVQPAHQPDDRDVADAYWPHVADHAYPYAALLNEGAALELGSDAPVAPLDPWDGIASAVTRTDDDRPPWHPEQALTLEQAVAATCGGSTTPKVGDIADLVIVDQDPTTVQPHELRDVTVHGTMLDGRWTFRSPGLSGLTTA